MTPGLFAAVKIEFDIQPGTFTVSVRQLNPTGSQIELSPSHQRTIIQVSLGDITPLPDLIRRLITMLPHLFGSPMNAGTANSIPGSDACGVLAPPWP